MHSGVRPSPSHMLEAILSLFLLFPSFLFFRDRLLHAIQSLRCYAQRKTGARVSACADRSVLGRTLYPTYWLSLQLSRNCHLCPPRPSPCGPHAALSSPSLVQPCLPPLPPLPPLLPPPHGTLFPPFSIVLALLCLIHVESILGRVDDFVFIILAY